MIKEPSYAIMEIHLSIYVSSMSSEALKVNRATIAKIIWFSSMIFASSSSALMSVAQDRR